MTISCVSLKLCSFDVYDSNCCEHNYFTICFNFNISALSSTTNMIIQHHSIFMFASVINNSHRTHKSKWKIEINENWVFIQKLFSNGSEIQLQMSQNKVIFAGGEEASRLTSLSIFPWSQNNLRIFLLHKENPATWRLKKIW